MLKLENAQQDSSSASALNQLASLVGQRKVHQLCPRELEGLLEACLSQVEQDDNFSPQAADHLVDALLEARDLMESFQIPDKPLQTAVSVFLSSQQEKSFYAQWQERANKLRRSQLRTALWDQFQEACLLIDTGRGEWVRNWLQATIFELELKVQEYSRLYVRDEEVTMESEMCHRFLHSGAEAWLIALRGLQSRVEVGSCSYDYRAMADFGQRRLICVQQFEQEASRGEKKFFVNFN